MTETNDKKWSRAGLGDLPPMVHLDEKDIITGTVEDVRDINRKDSKKKKSQIGLHILLTEPAKVSTGSMKKKTLKRVSYSAGDKICVTVGGNLSTLLKDMILKTTGEDLSKITSDELTSSHLRAGLLSKEIRIERLENGEIQEGEFKGNMVKRYQLDYAAPAIA